MGYKIMKIHEVWHFQEEQRKEGVFSPYENSWLKYKTEASGWRKHCDTQEHKDQYVNDVEAREGIKFENMDKNSGGNKLPS